MADNRWNRTQTTFETKQANNCHPNYFIMADNRVTQKTERLPEWHDDQKKIKTQRVFLRDKQNAYNTRCTVKPFLFSSQLLFLQIIYNSKQFPLRGCLDCLIVISLKYKLILTSLIQSQMWPSPYMATNELPLPRCFTSWALAIPKSVSQTQVCGIQKAPLCVVITYAEKCL